MTASQFSRLLLLACIWGASFLCIRLAVQQLSAFQLMASRVLLAASFLMIIGWWWRRPALPWQRYRHFLLLGFINSALPFVLYAVSAKWLTASLLSVLNATAPMWGAVIGAVAFGQRIYWRTVVGLLAGVIGVALLVGLDPTLTPDALLGVLCATGAAACYGLGTHLTKRAAPLDPFINAHGSMWGALVCLLPVALWQPIPLQISAVTVVAVLLLSILCTGVAYLLYFGLIRDVGATSTLTVTYLIPLFGIGWGVLLLDEHVGWHTAAGAAIVLFGTAWVTGFQLKLPNFTAKN